MLPLSDCKILHLDDDAKIITTTSAIFSSTGGTPDGTLWGYGNDVLERRLLLSSGRSLACRSSLYSFECAPLAEAG